MFKIRPFWMLTPGESDCSTVCETSDGFQLKASCWYRTYGFLCPLRHFVKTFIDICHQLGSIGTRHGPCSSPCESLISRRNYNKEAKRKKINKGKSETLNEDMRATSTTKTGTKKAALPCCWILMSLRGMIRFLQEDWRWRRWHTCTDWCREPSNDTWKYFYNSNDTYNIEM